MSELLCKVKTHKNFGKMHENDGKTAEKDKAAKNCFTTANTMIMLPKLSKFLKSILKLPQTKNGLKSVKKSNKPFFSQGSNFHIFHGKRK